MQIDVFERSVGVWQWRVGRYIRRNDERTVRAHFGISLPVIVLVWWHLNTVFALAGLRGDHLLWTLYFVRVYPTEDQGAVFCGCSRPTFRDRISMGIFIIYTHLHVVRFIFILFH